MYISIASYMHVNHCRSMQAFIINKNLVPIKLAKKVRYLGGTAERLIQVSNQQPLLRTEGPRSYLNWVWMAVLIVMCLMIG